MTTFELHVSGTANISASEKRSVKSSAQGTVDRVHVEDGQTVTEGQMVMTINNDALVHQLEQARVDLEAQKVRLLALLSPSAADHALTESGLKTAETALENRRKDVSEGMSIVATAGGRVASVRVNPDDAVVPGQLVVTIVDDTEILVVVQVPQAEIAKVKGGQPAAVASGSELPPADGTVDSIGAEAQAGIRKPWVPVSVKVQNPGRIYRAGLSANATINVGRDERVSAGGSIAPKVRYDLRAEVTGNVAAVFIKRRGRCEGRGSYTEVVSGVSEGEVVVLSSLNRKRVDPFTDK